MKATHIVSFILLVIGGLNWGLVGLGMWFGYGMGWNLVNQLFGSIPWLESTVYVLVGVATLVLIATHKRSCTCCKKDASAAPTM